MGLVRKAEDALTGHHQESGRSTNHGPHESNILNKLDPRVDSDKDNRARHQAMGGTAGPHSSDIANKVDPRVDSDRDNRANDPFSTGAKRIDPPNDLGHGTTVPHQTNATSQVDPRFDSLESAHNRNNIRFDTAAKNPGTSSTNAGPHSSNLANKLDPRVDSDMDNRARHETLAGSSYNKAGTKATVGPHATDTANKLDPRVDSDLDNRKAGAQREFV